MRLIYTGTNNEVKCGDIVHLNSIPYSITGFDKPHKPSSTGKVYVKEMVEPGFSMQYYPSVIGAQWVDAEWVE